MRLTAVEGTIGRIVKVFATVPRSLLIVVGHARGSQCYSNKIADLFVTDILRQLNFEKVQYNAIPLAASQQRRSRCVAQYCAAVETDLEISAA